ncbi:hypothetical protein ACWEKT_02835 [Nocardia takedensis]
MSETVTARGRPVLPNMERLLMVWEGRDTAATSLEHATQVIRSLWITPLGELDLDAAAATWGDGGQPSDVGNMHARIAQVVDDEVTWRLGNRLDLVTVLDEDSQEFTVGELIAVITMLGVQLDRWPHQWGECPLAPAFVAAVRDYDALIADLLAGRRAQPRRPSQGLPPIREPRRIELPLITPAPPDNPAATPPSPLDTDSPR